jgi:hypothetical protein
MSRGVGRARKCTWHTTAGASARSEALTERVLPRPASTYTNIIASLKPCPARTATGPARARSTGLVRSMCAHSSHLDAEAGKGSTHRDRRETVSLAAVTRFMKGSPHVAYRKIAPRHHVHGGA